MPQIATWTLSIADPNGRVLANFKANWPNNKVTWDGTTLDGSPLVPGTPYVIDAKAQDEYGNIGDLQGALKVEGLAAVTEPSSIVAQSSGFAPKGDGSDGLMGFAITVGDMSSLSAWKIEILDSAGVVARTMNGSNKQVVSKAFWDGKTDGGTLAPEGRYSARLSLDYGFNYAPFVASTKPFVLDLTPPTGKIAFYSALFSPDGDGTSDTVTATATAAAPLARVESWTMTVLDPGNNPFASWKGAWPMEPIVWDGRGSKGDLVESASDYKFVLRLRDEFGNTSEISKYSQDGHPRAEGPRWLPHQGAQHRVQGVHGRLQGCARGPRRRGTARPSISWPPNSRNFPTIGSGSRAMRS